ncbi:MAG: ATP-binding protein [Armatimonadota bacterium]
MGLLPTQRTPPKRRLCDHTIFIFGPPKAGKTTLAARFPDALILATEDGQGCLECYRAPVNDWPTFLALCNEIAQGKHPFLTLVVDTVDNLWALCQRFICEKHKVEHESDMPYGKGYGLVLAEFTRVLTKLSMLDYGLVLISHAEQEEQQARTGTYQRWVPSVRDKVRRFLLGMCDFILFVDQETTVGPDGQTVTSRFLRTKPSFRWIAGDRTGRLPESIPLDYDAFLAAFEAAQQCPAMPGPGNSATPQGEDHDQ